MPAWKAIALGACGSAALLSLNPTRAQAAVLVTYPLTNASGLNYSSLNSSVLSAASPLTKGNLTSFTINNGESCCSGSYVLSTSPKTSITGANAATALSNNWYFSISLTPATVMNIDSVSLNWARGGTNNIRGWLLRSSRDNYTTDLYSVTTAASSSTSLRSVSQNLTSFTNLSSTTDFRFYIFSSGVGQTLDFSAITFNGSAPAAQVPAPLPLAGLAAAFRTSRRLRRRLRNQAG